MLNQLRMKFACWLGSIFSCQVVCQQQTHTCGLHMSDLTGQDGWIVNYSFSELANYMTGAITSLI